MTFAHRSIPSTTPILIATAASKYHPDFLSLACPAKPEGERIKGDGEPLTWHRAPS
jgi:hypothetical protein